MSTTALAVPAEQGACRCLRRHWHRAGWSRLRQQAAGGLRGIERGRKRRGGKGEHLFTREAVALLKGSRHQLADAGSRLPRPVEQNELLRQGLSSGSQGRQNPWPPPNHRPRCCWYQRPRPSVMPRRPRGCSMTSSGFQKRVAPVPRIPGGSCEMKCGVV